MTAQPAPRRRTWYVKRTTWRPCENGDRVATCHHQPRCGPMRAGQRPGDQPFGRWVHGWTRVRGSAQAGREAAAWQATGWTTEVVPTSPQVRAADRAWERAARGYPGEATSPART